MEAHPALPLQDDDDLNSTVADLVGARAILAITSHIEGNEDLARGLEISPAWDAAARNAVRTRKAQNFYDEIIVRVAGVLQRLRSAEGDGAHTAYLRARKTIRRTLCASVGRHLTDASATKLYVAEMFKRIDRRVHSTKATNRRVAARAGAKG
jgi:hypothetical protein